MTDTKRDRSNNRKHKHENNNNKREHVDESTLKKELQFAEFVLTKWPKSTAAFAHRRWAFRKHFFPIECDDEDEERENDNKDKEPEDDTYKTDKQLPPTTEHEEENQQTYKNTIANNNPNHQTHQPPQQNTPKIKTNTPTTNNKHQ